MLEVYIHVGLSRDRLQYVKAGMAAKGQSSNRIRGYADQYELGVTRREVWKLPVGQDNSHVEKKIQANLLRMGFEVKHNYKSRDKKTTAEELYVTNQFFEDIFFLFYYARAIASATITYCEGGKIDEHRVGEVNCEELQNFDNFEFYEKVGAIERFMIANTRDSKLKKKFPGWYELTYDNEDIYQSLKRIQHSNKPLDLAIDSEINEKSVHIFSGPHFEQENLVKFYIRDPRSLTENHDLTIYYQSHPGFHWNIAAQNFRLLEIHRKQVEQEGSDTLHFNWYPCYDYHCNRIADLVGVLEKMSRIDALLHLQDNSSNVKAIAFNASSKVELKDNCFIIDDMHVVVTSIISPDELPDNYYRLHSKHFYAQEIFLYYLDERSKEAIIDFKGSRIKYYIKELADCGFQFQQSINQIQKTLDALSNAIGESIILSGKPIFEEFVR